MAAELDHVAASDPTPPSRRRGRAAGHTPAIWGRGPLEGGDLRAHDAELDGGPPVPPLVDLTVFGDNRIEIYLRRSDDGWRAVRVVFDESCTTGPDR